MYLLFKGAVRVNYVSIDDSSVYSLRKGLTREKVVNTTKIMELLPIDPIVMVT
jgi:hypothetical protein